MCLPHAAHIHRTPTKNTGRYRALQKFYTDLGFTINWSNEQIAELQISAFRFLLQTFYVAEHAGIIPVFGSVGILRHRERPFVVLAFAPHQCEPCQIKRKIACNLNSPNPDSRKPLIVTSAFASLPKALWQIPHNRIPATSRVAEAFITSGRWLVMGDQ